MVLLHTPMEVTVILLLYIKTPPPAVQNIFFVAREREIMLKPPALLIALVSVLDSDSDSDSDYQLL